MGVLLQDKKVGTLVVTSRVKVRTLSLYGRDNGEFERHRHLSSLSDGFLVYSGSKDVVVGSRTRRGPS